MNPITPLPPFAPFAPPPAPRILSLRATDLPARLSRRLITNEDLPLKSSHFHPYQRSPYIDSEHSLRPLSPRIHDGPVPSTSAKMNVSRTACDRVLTTSPLTSPSPTPPPRAPKPVPTSDDDNVEGPRRNPYRTISSAGPGVAPQVALKPCMKVRLERPKGAGRANLPRLLGWDDTLHDALKAVTRKSIVQHLNISLSFKSQDEKKLAQVRQEVVSIHPVLDDYVDMWPLEIIIARLLKYLSSHEKDKGFREAVEKLQACK